MKGNWNMKMKKTEIIGQAYRELKDLVRRYANKTYPVLFVGETGSGKEVFANLYMASSNREQKRMGTINCAGYSEELLRSEVFGHVMGAFTGSVRNRAGLLRACDNGILFLDELGDASSEFQAVLLRVSEGHPFYPVGSDVEVEVNTLIIAATNRPHKVREDLRQRFHILPVPPLQKFDIPELAKHFLGKPLKKKVIEELMARDYPGNVRELKKVCEQFLAEKGEIIFDKRGSGLLSKGDYFDYDRYRREYLTWSKYIQPLIDRYHLGFRYEYFIPDALSASVISRVNKLIVTFQNDPTYYEYTKRNPLGTPEEWAPGLLDIIRYLNDGLEVASFDYNGNVVDPPGNSGKIELLPIFRTKMTQLIQMCGLPHLLKEIVQQFDHRSFTQDERPNLLPLLDLKYDEARKGFESHYFVYHIGKNSNRTEAAKVMGLNPNTLKTKLQRLRKNAMNFESKRTRSY